METVQKSHKTAKILNFQSKTTIPAMAAEQNTETKSRKRIIKQQSNIPGKQKNLAGYYTAECTAEELIFLRKYRQTNEEQKEILQRVFEAF